MYSSDSDNPGYSARKRAEDEAKIQASLEDQLAVILQAKVQSRNAQECWLRGAEGEEKMAVAIEAAVAAADDEWFVLYDLRTDLVTRRNVDAILVGPTVLVLDAKNWKVAPVVEGGRILWGEKDFGVVHELRAQYERTGAIVHRLVSDIEHRVVLVSVGEEPAMSASVDDGISVIDVGELPALLTASAAAARRGGTALSHDEARELAWRLEHFLIPARTVEERGGTAEAGCPVCGTKGGLCMGWLTTAS